MVIRLRCAIAILYENHCQNLSQQEKVVLEPTFIVKVIKNNDVCHLFSDIRIIICHPVVSMVDSNSINISDKCLNS